MFCKKTYRKTRWIERLLNHGLPTKDCDSPFDEGEDEGLGNEYDGYYDDDYNEFAWREPKKWMIVNAKFRIAIKRGRWTLVKYFRIAYENDKPYIECRTHPTSRTMKIYKPRNHIGERNVSVSLAE